MELQDNGVDGYGIQGRTTKTKNRTHKTKWKNRCKNC